MYPVQVLQLPSLEETAESTLPPHAGLRPALFRKLTQTYFPKAQGMMKMKVFSLLL